MPSPLPVDFPHPAANPLPYAAFGGLYFLVSALWLTFKMSSPAGAAVS